MKELGITKGEWVVEQYGGYYTLQNRIGYEGDDLLSSEGVGSFEAEHNAELICDAGNTAQKCGLLPSELLQQRDELLKTMKSIYCTTDASDQNSMQHAIYRIGAAIKNTGG